MCIMLAPLQPTFKCQTCITFLIFKKCVFILNVELLRLVVGSDINHVIVEKKDGKTEEKYCQVLKMLANVPSAGAGSNN